MECWWTLNTKWYDKTMKMFYIRMTNNVIIILKHSNCSDFVVIIRWRLWLQCRRFSNSFSPSPLPYTHAHAVTRGCAHTHMNGWCHRYFEKNTNTFPGCYITCFFVGGANLFYFHLILYRLSGWLLFNF